jgi:hypothetical protein
MPASSLRAVPPTSHAQTPLSAAIAAAARRRRSAVITAAQRPPPPPLSRTSPVGATAALSGHRRCRSPPPIGGHHRRSAATAAAAQSASPHNPRRRRRSTCCKHLCDGVLANRDMLARKTIPFLLANRIPFMRACGQCRASCRARKNALSPSWTRVQDTPWSNRNGHLLLFS